LQERFADWSPDGSARLGPPGGRQAQQRRIRIGYYLWVYPALSETFIRREITALRAAGVPLAVLADSTGYLPPQDPLASDPSQEVGYVLPISVGQVVREALYYIMRRPVTLARLVFFVVVTRYDREKSIGTDARIVAKALCVAGRMRELHVDHVHSPWASTNAFILLIASRLLGVPYSVQARAHELHRHDSAFALRQKFTHASFVVTNTRFNEAGLRAILPQDQWPKIHRIYNGIDLADFDPPARTIDALARVRILSVARLIEQKGLTLLLEACAELRDRGIDFSCDIIGGPEEPLYTGYRVKLGVLHRRLALQDRVRFLGPLPLGAVLQAYRCADIFVLPCVVAANGSKDITPNVLLEAMAMQLPVVSTELTGIPEIVTAERSGLLVPPGDVAALCDALLRLIKDPCLRVTLGVAAREAVERRFDVRSNVQEYVRLFSLGDQPCRT